MGPHPKRKIISLARVTAPPIPPPRAPVPPPAETAPLKPPKTSRTLAREAALKWLSETYPLAFGVEARPLALGIGHQVWPQAKTAGVQHRALHDALKWRTSSFRYLNALSRDGAMRFDLEGNAVAPVSGEHRRRALEMKAEFDRVQRERAEALKGPGS